MPTLRSDRGVPVVVGIGGRADVDVASIADAIAHCLRPDWTVTALATLDRKADVVTAVASGMGVRVVVYSAGDLADTAVPNPSELVAEHAGSASVAEAAAVRASGGGRLLVPKTVWGAATIAVAEVDRTTQQADDESS